MYNLNVASSDSDYLAVFASDTCEVLADLNCTDLVPQDKPGHTHADTCNESMGNQGNSYSIEHRCYEARLFCESLLKGNHSIVGAYACASPPLHSPPRAPLPHRARLCQ